MAETSPGELGRRRDALLGDAQLDPRDVVRLCDVLVRLHRDATGHHLRRHVDRQVRVRSVDKARHSAVRIDLEVAVLVHLDVGVRGVDDDAGDVEVGAAQRQGDAGLLDQIERCLFSPRGRLALQQEDGAVVVRLGGVAVEPDARVRRIALQPARDLRVGDDAVELTDGREGLDGVTGHLLERVCRLVRRLRRRGGSHLRRLERVLDGGGVAGVVRCHSDHHEGEEDSARDGAEGVAGELHLLTP